MLVNGLWGMKAGIRTSVGRQSWDCYHSGSNSVGREMGLEYLDIPSRGSTFLVFRQF
jgi:hypothetical protein